MALTLGAATSDRVNVSPSSAINNLSAATWVFWLYPTSFSGRRIACRGGSGHSELFLNPNGTITASIDRVTTNASYTTNSALSANAWQFVGVTYDLSAGSGEVVNVYLGTLTVAASESTYSATNDGSGLLADDSSRDFIVGNRSTNNSAFEGRIAHVAIWNRQLNLAELVQQQFRPRNGSGCVMLFHLGFNGTGLQIDYSGNGNHGTVTGASVTPDHVPLGPAFGFDAPVMWRPPVLGKLWQVNQAVPRAAYW